MTKRESIEKSKFLDLLHTWVEGIDRWYENEEILKFVPFRLLASFLRKNPYLSDFEKNYVLVKNSQSLTDFVKIFPKLLPF